MNQVKQVVRQCVQEKRQTSFDAVYEEVLKLCGAANAKELSFQTSIALEEVKSEKKEYPECANLYI